MRLKWALLLLVAGLLLQSTAFAWKITPELQKETEEKLKAVEENYYYPHPHFDLAITYAYTNKIKEGWDELKKVNELDPEFAPLAMKIYERKVFMDPNDWKMRFRLAFAYYFNNKKEEAFDQMEKIIKLDPNNIFAYGYAGMILGDMGKIDEAIEYINKGLAIDNQVAALHLLLAQAYSKKGESWKSFSEGVEALRLKALGY